LGNFRISKGFGASASLRIAFPLDFYPDRKLKAAADVVWEAEGRALPLKLKGEVFQIPEDSTYGCFLEP
jgi:hypothetical protein